MVNPLKPMQAQWFPQYLAFGPVQFQDANGDPSGAAGAQARLSRSLPNWPILFIALRLDNVFNLPASPSDTDLRTYVAAKQFLDTEQTVRINLSQQNITAEATLQSHITGKGGTYYSPFPVPFPMAGANNIAVEVVRQTPYPQINQELILPTCYGTIVAMQARMSEQTVAPQRIHGYDAKDYVEDIR